ncbi:hypothetical protein ABT115_16455 [Streptomyces sp. NPDC001832]|uniref:hypothetical protein n=1 Tax=Streptomyces sp. NPDC001832 TaxID=3154527 RepID=UPI00331A6C41
MSYLIRATIASAVLGLVALCGQAQSAGTEAGTHTHLRADSAWGRSAAADDHQ